VTPILKKKIGQKGVSYTLENGMSFK